MKLEKIAWYQIDFYRYQILSKAPTESVSLKSPSQSISNFNATQYRNSLMIESITSLNSQLSMYK